MFSITGEHVVDDMVSQADLAHGSELQITAWRIERECQEYMKKIATRVRHGATVEAGALAWDGENEMVRGRRKEGSG